MLTRRVKQGVVEWYVLDLLEKSWGGFEMHTEAGFNIGKPCYGYRASKVPHPVRPSAPRGSRKHGWKPNRSRQQQCARHSAGASRSSWVTRRFQRA